MRVINIDKHGNIIPDLSKVIVKMDDHPELANACRGILIRHGK